MKGKNILKEAGVLLIVSILVCTTVCVSMSVTKGTNKTSTTAGTFSNPMMKTTTNSDLNITITRPVPGYLYLFDKYEIPINFLKKRQTSIIIGHTFTFKAESSWTNLSTVNWTINLKNYGSINSGDINVTESGDISYEAEAPSPGPPPETPFAIFDVNGHLIGVITKDGYMDIREYECKELEEIWASRNQA